MASSITMINSTDRQTDRQTDRVGNSNDGKQCIDVTVYLCRY